MMTDEQMDINKAYANLNDMYLSYYSTPPRKYHYKRSVYLGSQELMLFGLSLILIGFGIFFAAIDSSAMGLLYGATISSLGLVYFLVILRASIDYEIVYDEPEQVTKTRKGRVKG